MAAVTDAVVNAAKSAAVMTAGSNHVVAATAVVVDAVAAAMNGYCISCSDCCSRCCGSYCCSCSD